MKRRVHAGGARCAHVGLVALVTAIACLLPGCASTPDPSSVVLGDEAAAFAYLEDFIEGQRKQSGTVGLSVAIADADGVVWSSGFGYADKAQEVAATSGTLYDLASVTKVFTATAIMQLVEDGVVELDAPVSAYLPEFEPASRFPGAQPITVRNLLTHEAGIQPDWLKGMLYESPVQVPDERFLETATRLQGVEVCWPPEYVNAYSNLGYSLLGTIIHRTSGQSFFEYMREHVLGAVGMDDTAYYFGPGSIDGISVGYSGGKPVPHFAEREIPAGSLASSVDELGLFMSAYLNSDDTRLLEPATRDRMYERQNGHIARDLDFGQGISWMISDHGFEDLGRSVFHDGGEWSSNTSINLLPDLGFGVAVLTNSAEGSQITGLITREVIRVMHRVLTGEDPAAYERAPDVELAADESLAGLYYYQSLGIVEVVVKKDQLWAISGGIKMKMIPNASGRYRLQPILLGFIPINMAFLEPMEISFREVEGDMLSGVYQDGAAFPESGLRIERPVLSEIWYEREGTYELTNADEGEFPIIAPWEFSIRDGFPTISGRLYGSSGFSLVVIPQDDELTLWAGLGRRAGDTIRFEERGADTLIHYQGFVYRKTGR